MSNAGGEGLGNPNNASNGSEPTSTSMSDSLKRLLVQCTSLGNTGPADGQGANLSDEDKKFLEAALQSTVKPQGNALLEIVEGLDKLCRESREASEEEASLLDSLEEMTEDMYKGDDFIGMGGIKLCERLILEQPSQIITTCNIIANISSNNQVFHNHPDGKVLLRHILLQTMRDSPDLTPSVKSKLLYAASCAMSSNTAGIEYVLKDPDLGIEYFFNMYTTRSPNVQVKKRVGRIIGVIFRDVFDPKLLKSDFTMDFCKRILETWWSESNAFVYVNLNTLHAIYVGKNQSIRHQLKSEVGSDIDQILKKMRKLQEANDAENAVDADDELSILETFERDLAETSAPTSAPAALSICMKPE